MRRYYSVRMGRNDDFKLNLDILKQAFCDLYVDFERRCYFQDAFGYYCVDEGQVPGALGLNLETQFTRRLRKDGLWPVGEKCSGYSEEDLFDVIELLYDLISKPVKGQHHSFGNCGWHYWSFNKQEGQDEYRTLVNELLTDYEDGYELSTDGEILLKGQSGLDSLLHTELPTLDPENVNGRVIAAVRKYRRHHSTLDERRDAIRDLADVLEYLRPRLKEVITKKDEDDLFNLANSFGVRHHNDRQKIDYDQAVWYSWMFYYYLATVHAVVRLLERSKQDRPAV